MGIDPQQGTSLISDTRQWKIGDNISIDINI